MNCCIENSLIRCHRKLVVAGPQGCNPPSAPNHEEHEEHEEEQRELRDPRVLRGEFMQFWPLLGEKQGHPRTMGCTPLFCRWILQRYRIPVHCNTTQTNSVAVLVKYYASDAVSFLSRSCHPHNATSGIFQAGWPCYLFQRQHASVYS